MAYFHPSHPWVAPGLREFDSKPSWNLIAQLQFVLFYTSMPPRRFALTLAAFDSRPTPTVIRFQRHLA
jgi:hypothetical protein